MTVQPPPPTYEPPGRRPRHGARLAAWWTQAKASAPTTLALLSVAAVWALGAVWSFTEQKAFAGDKGFADTPILPLVFDGFAIATALVAYAASLDGRPAVPARLATVLGVVASASSNGVWAAQRSAVHEVPDWTAVTIGVAIPVLANIAFEVLLAELRRQVQRRRGMPAPVALPPLRLIRLVLAPLSTFTAWREEVLDRTATKPLDDPARWGGLDEVEQPSTAPSTEPEAQPEIEPAPAPPQLHLAPPPKALDAGLDAPLDTDLDIPPDLRSLFVPGVYRSARKQRRVAECLGVARRPEWDVPKFNKAIDAHLKKHGPKRAAS